MPSIKTQLVERVGHFIRKHHMNPFLTLSARVCNRYLSYYWNQMYWDMEKNGELLFLKTLANEKNVTIFDVGANVGSYTEISRSTIPDSTIHSFEIVPYTYEKLEQNLADMERVITNNFGLSNEKKMINMNYNPENSSEAREVSSLYQLKDVVSCETRTGDSYVAENNIEKIDLLKIDTEGHEISVLEGFQQTFQDKKVRMIQFEYGTTWIAPSRFLHEAYAILEPAGFVIGRLYPNGIFFKPYDRLEDEHFRMGNYIAVQKSSLSLVESLNLNPKTRISKLRPKRK